MTRVLTLVLAAALSVGAVIAPAPAPARDPWSERLDLLVEARGELMRGELMRGDREPRG